MQFQGAQVAADRVMKTMPTFAAASSSVPEARSPGRPTNNSSWTRPLELEADCHTSHKLNGGLIDTLLEDLANFWSTVCLTLPDTGILEKRQTENIIIASSIPCANAWACIRIGKQCEEISLLNLEMQVDALKSHILPTWTWKHTGRLFCEVYSFIMLLAWRPFASRGSTGWLLSMPIVRDMASHSASASTQSIGDLERLRHTF